MEENAFISDCVKSLGKLLFKFYTLTSLFFAHVFATEDYTYLLQCYCMILVFNVIFPNVASKVSCDSYGGWEYLLMN